MIVCRANPDETLRVIMLLLDLWKVGIQECIVDVSATTQAVDKLLRV